METSILALQLLSQKLNIKESLSFLIVKDQNRLVLKPFQIIKKNQ